jgi:LCP family protein required for cell wall assembly
VENAIPQADLLGTPTPTASSATVVAPASPTAPPGSDIKGPLNILIVGVDTRVSVRDWIPHADAVMIMHVNKDLTSAWLTSLPRDLVVNIPAFAPARFGGARTKLTHAMSYGARVPGSSTPNPAQGVQLVAKTVSAYTGIQQFDGAALTTFNGLTALIDGIGGIDIYIDQNVTSIHRRPDGQYRTVCGGCSHGYSGPQAQYNMGNTHLAGWQALDYARQRYIPGGDYARGRHQRQIIKAIVTRLFNTPFMTDLQSIDNLVTVLGSSLIIDARGRRPMEFAWALHNLKAQNITLVGLPGGGAYAGGSYIGESLNGIQSSYFSALRADNLQAFLAANPGLTNSSA